MIVKYVKTDCDKPVAKRSRKSLHLTDSSTKDISDFIDILNSKSIIIPDKRPNTAIKDLENYIKTIYDVPSPECFLMNGEEYSGDRYLHELTREKYLYVPFQSALDIEIRFFSLRKVEVLVETLKSLDTAQMKSIDRNYIDGIKYGVDIVNFQKRKIKSQNNGGLSAFIPQILRGNTCEDANEEKIDDLMRHRYKSSPINIKQNIAHFKQLIELELKINLGKVEVFDLYRFHKLPENMPLSTFITMANDYTDFIISFRFKQMPKINLICIVINQITPVQLATEEKPEMASVLPLNVSPPKELLLPSLDSTKKTDKEQWLILDNFSHSCNIKDPQEWSSLELELWLNYIRTSFNIVPKDRATQALVKMGFFDILLDKSQLATVFKPRDNSDYNELTMSRFFRHCELLVKYKLFYYFNQFVLKKMPRVCTTPSAPPQPSKSKGATGRSKAQREDLVKRSGGRREIQFNSNNLMETRLGKSLYSGKNSTNSTTIAQFQHRKWTFFLKCLVQPVRATEVAWIDYDGIFRLVEQDAIAKMYGETCNKPDMTYDKLSRGLRYDRSGIIDKVDKNYCWKFTVPVIEIVGMSVEKIVSKMYKFYKKRNSNYPADILLKESITKKEAKPIGPMRLLERDPIEDANEDRVQALIEADYCETYSRAGYMSTDRRINFWLNPELIGPDKYRRRLMQGRLVHSVMPNELEFIALTALNENRIGFEGTPHESWTMKHELAAHDDEDGDGDGCQGLDTDEQDRDKVSPRGPGSIIQEDPLLAELAMRNRNDSLTFDYQYHLVGPADGTPIPDVEEELVIDSLYDQDHLHCLE